MLIQIKGGQTLPKYISTENDPLFNCHRWQANLGILDIEEIKSAPGIPTPYSFIERVIGTCRCVFLDHLLFWNEQDLQRKLVSFQHFYNEHHTHMSLENTTPNQKAAESEPVTNLIHLEDDRWKTHCRGLFNLPIAT